MELPDFEKLSVKKYKGTCLFANCEIESIQNMAIQDDDTWVLSFPRSGTTLTQEIVYLLKTGVDIDRAKESPVDERFPFLDMCHPTLPLLRGLTSVEKQSSPRLIKSHLHYHVLPPQLFKSSCKKVYVMRNPKDVLVSCEMLTRFLQQVDVNYKDYHQDWLNSTTYATPWWQHVRDFWLHRSDKNILILKYEEIVTDMKTAILQIAQHLDVVVTDEDVDKIADHCQFDKMKSNASTNAEWQNDCRSGDKTFGGHIRKGKIGGWRDHLSSSISEQVDHMVQDKLSDLDLTFDYGS